MTELPNNPIITLAGMTNAGKSVFLRTFLRDQSIGVVGAGTGTTSAVDEYPLYLENEEDLLCFICDTPGFQSIDLLVQLLNAQFPERNIESFSVKEISNLIPQGKDKPDAAPYRHDSITWEQIQKSDTVLAVIDVTEDPDLGGPQRLLLRFWKLIQKEKNLIIILNRRHYKRKDDLLPNYDLLVDKWRRILEKESLGPIIEYDPNYRDMEVESTLFDLLAECHSSLRRRFIRKKERRLAEEKQLCQYSIQKIVTYLLKIATTREKLGKGKEQDRTETEKAEKKVHSNLQSSEEQFVQDITKIWGFSASIVSEIGDFSPNVHRVEESFAKQRFLKGAAIGAFIDIPFAGFSLGAGSLIGAATGGIVGKAYDMIQTKYFKSTRKSVYYIPDVKFFNMAIDRSLGLLTTLYHRGHGMSEKATIKLCQMPIIELSQAVDILQVIATQNWPHVLQLYLTKSLKEKLTIIFSDYLSSHLNQSDMTSINIIK